MNRLFRILRFRWRTVLVIVALTMVAALWVADLRNESIEPRFEASAPVTFVDSLEEFEVLGPSLLETVETQLEDAQVKAEEINDDLLQNRGYEIVADPAIGRLTFVAQAATADEAVAGATEMRDRVLRERPFNIDSEIERQIQATLTQLDSVREEIARVSAEVQVDPAVEEERLRLSTLLTELEARELQLEQWSRVPPTGEDALTPGQIASELAQVKAAIADVEADLAALPPAVDPLSAGATQLRALQRQYEELEIRYQNLLIQRSDLQTLPLVGDIEVLDVTPSEIPMELAAAVALALGLALAFVVLVMTERMAAPVWFPLDVPEIPFLPTIASRPKGDRNWYLRSGQSGRKAAIQAVRSAIRARANSDEVVVTVAGSGIGSTDLQLLAVDLAAAFASTASKTALVDASFDSSWHAAEFRQPGFTLADVVLRTDADDQIQSLLDSADVESDGERSIPLVVGSGDGIAVPADALAGPRIGSLFDLLRETLDVVIVAADDIEMPTTQAMLDRSDIVILLTRPGASRQATLVGFSEELAYRQVDLMAAFVHTPFILSLRQPTFSLRERLRRRRGRVGVATFGERPVYDAPPQVAASSAGRRLTEVPPPAEPAVEEPTQPAPVPASVSAEEAIAEMEELLAESQEEVEVRVDRPVLAAVESEPVLDEPEYRWLHAGALYELLQENDPPRVTADAEDFMVDSVTRLVLARDDDGLDPTNVAEIRQAGFVPLSTWKGHPSLGSRLRHEFRNQLGKKEAAHFEELLLKALSFGGDSSDATSLDRWVGRRYFELHAAREDWAPRVWHIMSRGGTISALVAAERFDKPRMESFVDGVVIRVIESLARRRRRKELVGDHPAMEQLDAQIEDAREFGLAIAWLIEGSRPESRLWYPKLRKDQQPTGWAPDWSYGIKVNLAPIQRLGILAVPVLTESELKTFEPTG